VTRTLREQLSTATVAAAALLPLRLFLGVTFVYAGLDKLLDPTFFDPSSPTSIQAQLVEFARVSPIAFLVGPVEPFAILVGGAIALAEVAVGIGTLSGLAFRLSATVGAVLSILFWLTASWTTHPYFYGPDLPYALGWVTLVLAGHGGLLVPAAIGRLGQTVDDGQPGTIIEPSPGRRQLLQATVLGALTLFVGSMAIPLGIALPPRVDDAAGDLGTAASPSDGASPGASPGASAGAPAPSFHPTGLTVSTIAAVDARGAARIKVPIDAPAPFPAGDPGIIVKLPDGSYVAYDATCTHEGCRVGWDAADAVLVCPCHGAEFDATNHGAVLAGPTSIPLTELPIVVDHQAGTISLKA
jgi:thiosulfate dehydrogenase [quinone] large subunit